MKCAICNHDSVNQNANFCVFCGNKFKQGVYYCTHCGSKLIKNANFCTECGTKINRMNTNDEEEELIDNKIIVVCEKGDVAVKNSIQENVIDTEVDVMNNLSNEDIQENEIDTEVDVMNNLFNENIQENVDIAVLNEETQENADNVAPDEKLQENADSVVLNKNRLENADNVVLDRDVNQLLPVVIKENNKSLAVIKTEIEDEINELKNSKNMLVLFRCIKNIVFIVGKCIKTSLVASASLVTFVVVSVLIVAATAIITRNYLNKHYYEAKPSSDDSYSIFKVKDNEQDCSSYKEYSAGE